MKSRIFGILLGILLISGAIYSAYAMQNDRIYKYGINRGYALKSIDYVWVFDPDCPFWRYKNDCVKRAVFTDHNGQRHVVYFQFHPLGMRKKEIPPL